jgi:hypothetical protein
MEVTKAKDSNFLNVDLVIYSKTDLRPLVDAMGGKIIELHVGRVRRSYYAYLEISGIPRSAQSAIRNFCRLIQKLPRPAKKLWEGARFRRFDIGIDSVPRGTHWFEISKEAVAEAAKLNATIAVTVYGKLRKAKLPKKASRFPTRNP